MKSAKKAVKKAAVARKKAAAKKAGRVARKAVARPKVAAVATANGDAKVDGRSALQEEYTIEAKNFGPIAEAKLTLKPLTVLIGPSNTGKTYMATLAYLMTNEHTQFIQGARQLMFLTPYESALKKTDENTLRNIATQLVSAVETNGRFVWLSDFPEKFRKDWHGMAKNMFKHRTWGNIGEDLGQYFGIGSDEGVDALIHAGHDELVCECNMHINGVESFRVRMRHIRGSRASTAARLKNFYFPVLPSAISEKTSEIKTMLAGAPAAFRKEAPARIESVVDNIFRGDRRGSAANLSAHFLPASREGLTRAQLIVRAGVMRAASQAGWPNISSVSLPRTVGDYMTEIDILLDRLAGHHERSNIVRRLGISRIRNLAHSNIRLRKSTPEVTAVAQKIEELLGGEIIAKTHGGSKHSPLNPPPTLVYRPQGMRTLDGERLELEMARASSMVGEIAPLVLYLKGGIEPGDTLFIEEPEAHLHPSAQTQMADILAAMVRAGIRVVITTHSDWMLPSIANIVRRGELGKDGKEAALTKEEVGVWLFERGKNGGSTTRELKFDAPPGSGDRGYIPDNLRDISDDLHNETADLLDAMDNRAAKMKKAK